MTEGFVRRLFATASGLMVALAVAGCVVDVDLGGSRLVCSDGRCPGGFTCVEERCVPESGGGEDAAPGDDAASADSAPAPDAPPADAAPPDAPPPTACEQQYGQAPGFVLCAEERGSCQFYVNSGGVDVTCADLCLDVGGGLCVTAGNASADPPEPFACVVQKETGCEVVNASQICTCTSNAIQ
jgi:hypothetical protein